MSMNRELKFRSWDPFRKKMYLKPTVSDGSDGDSTACVYLNDAIACHDEMPKQKKRGNRRLFLVLKSPSLFIFTKRIEL